MRAVNTEKEHRAAFTGSSTKREGVLNVGCAWRHSGLIAFKSRLYIRSRSRSPPRLLIRFNRLL